MKLAFRTSEAEISIWSCAGGRESYTSDTVEELARGYPGAELWLVIGTDMLTSFERWQRVPLNPRGRGPGRPAPGTRANCRR